MTIAEKIDHETVIKLGCLEMRRYFKHMPGNVFDKKSNFELLEWALNNCFKYFFVKKFEKLIIHTE